MAQDFLTLEEAAQRLGLTPQELNSMAQHREIRAFADRGVWRFRVTDIEELSRRKGLSSDQEIDVQSDIKGPATPDRIDLLVGPGSDDKIDLGAHTPQSLKFDEGPASSSFVFGGPGVRSSTPSAPKSNIDLDDDSIVPLGRETLAAGEGGSAIRLDSLSGKLSGRLPDSGVRLVDFDLNPINQSPSSRKLVPPPVPPPVTPSSGIKIPQTPAAKTGMGSGKMRPGPQGAPSGKMSKPPLPPVSAASSEFELRPSERELPNDSIFDFTTPSLPSLELELSDDLRSHDVVDLGSDLASPSSGGSMRGKIPVEDEESSSFELNLEGSSAEFATGPKTPLPSKSTKAKELSSEFDLSLDAPEESSSDFELTLEDSSGSSEAIPALADSDSSNNTARIPAEDVSVSEDSDFELALDEDSAVVDETGSEVVVIDEDEESSGVGAGAAVAGAAALAGAGALAAGRRKKGAVVQDDEEIEEFDEEEAELRPAAGRATEWGWISLIHIPTALVMVFTGFLLFEMVKGIWNTNSGKAVSGPVYNMISSILK